MAFVSGHEFTRAKKSRAEGASWLPQAVPGVPVEQRAMGRNLSRSPERLRSALEPSSYPLLRPSPSRPFLLRRLLFRHAARPPAPLPQPSRHHFRDPKNPSSNADPYKSASSFEGEPRGRNLDQPCLLLRARKGRNLDRPCLFLRARISVRARLLVVPKKPRREALPCCRRPPLGSPVAQRAMGPKPVAFARTPPPFPAPGSRLQAPGSRLPAPSSAAPSSQLKQYLRTVRPSEFPCGLTHKIPTLRTGNALSAHSRTELLFCRADCSGERRSSLHPETCSAPAQAGPPGSLRISPSPR